jgi:hypothetical protein
LVGGRGDLCSLEADMAFFEARLSLAGEAPDTLYQLAQIKTYQTLGALLGDTLKTLRPQPKTPADLRKTAV